MKWEDEKYDHHFSWLVTNPTSQERFHSCYLNCFGEWHSSSCSAGVSIFKSETKQSSESRERYWLLVRLSARYPPPPASRASLSGPRHVCEFCIFLRTFPQTRHRASSVFCLQRGVEYRPSDSFLFRLKRRLGCWAQPPEQIFAMSIIYNWHVPQQLTAEQFNDESRSLTRLWLKMSYTSFGLCPIRELFAWTGSFGRTDTQSANQWTAFFKG